MEEREGRGRIFLEEKVQRCIIPVILCFGHRVSRVDDQKPPRFSPLDASFFPSPGILGKAFPFPELCVDHEWQRS